MFLYSFALVVVAKLRSPSDVDPWVVGWGGIPWDPSVVCWVAHGGRDVASQLSVVGPPRAAAAVELWTLSLPAGDLWVSRAPWGPLGDTRKATHCVRGVVHGRLARRARGQSAASGAVDHLGYVAWGD
jgi:hypothetical protein